MGYNSEVEYKYINSPLLTKDVKSFEEGIHRWASYLITNNINLRQLAQVLCHTGNLKQGEERERCFKIYRHLAAELEAKGNGELLHYLERK